MFGTLMESFSRSLGAAVTSHTCVGFLAALGFLLLLTWRLWRFTIAPFLWPDEPRPLPYSIPILGHSWEFMYHSQALFHRGRSHFLNGEPYTLTIAGQKMIVVQSTQEVIELWKQTTAFTFEPFIAKLLETFGFNRQAVETMFHDDPGHLVLANAKCYALLSTANPKGQNYIKMQSEWLKHQLLPHENGNLDALQQRYMYYLFREMTLEKVSEALVPTSHGKGQTHSLKQFCRHIVVQCATRAFFGDKLFEVAPSFLASYQAYEDESWKVFFNYPVFMATSLHSAKDKALDDLVRFFALPKTQRPEQAWIFDTLDSELDSLGMKPRDRAGIMMLIIWAINHNAHRIAFWVFAHLLYDSTLLQDVHFETSKAFGPNGEINVKTLLSESPKLDSVWHEVLRIYNNASVARRATEDTTIGTKRAYKGDTIIGPFRQFHLDTRLFGQDALSFDAQRFLRSKNLQSIKAYSPFGGGTTLCPGRFFARAEVYIMVATTLQRFRIETVPGQPFPEVDLKTPSSAAMLAAQDLMIGLS